MMTNQMSKMNNKKKIQTIGGRRWIRTTEARSDRFTVCSLWPLGNSPKYKNGAGGRTWTPDLLITNQLLYQLSYTSKLKITLVEATGLEPAASWSQTEHSSKLSYAPKKQGNFFWFCTKSTKIIAVITFKIKILNCMYK